MEAAHFGGRRVRDRLGAASKRCCAVTIPCLPAEEAVGHEGDIFLQAALSVPRM